MGFSFQSVIQSRMSFPAHSPMCGRRGVVVASADLVHSKRSPDVIDAVTELVELRWSEAAGRRGSRLATGLVIRRSGAGRPQGDPLNPGSREQRR